ncbi:glycosyltransferase family 4 protein [Intrasporangium calvum]|uniref:D-inositol 3-phosphate glycosyltransferase n=1 Tax=Intrasporangium calvum TaxID=53358 RepID=A0ABT5GE46_9MICO|nr:glycosyltransferase family 4 protein [Intrasporangium calvum]MDC5695956.1 glycosyltransferase family 4 protein [Intrasporangium calvum]
MKVLMVVGESTGGIGAHVDRLTRDLRSAGVEVALATSSSTAAAFGWVDARRLWPVHRGIGAPRGLVDWHLLKNLAGTVDVVHAHGHQAAVVAAVAVARARPRPRLVISLHNTLPTGPVPGGVGSGATRAGGGVGSGATRVWRGVRTRVRDAARTSAHRAIRWALSRAALVTGASADLVSLAEDLGARRVELATVASPQVGELLASPRPSQEERHAERRQLRRDGHDVDPDLPLVLTIARIAPQKDLHALVAAAGAARTRAAWVVVGGGDERLRADLESELSGIPLRLVGPQRDVVRWLRAADVFVLPSRWEARALVVQEAMAAGLPVVATRTGGLPQLVGDAGLLVDVGDAQGIANAVDELLSDGPLRDRLGAAARSEAQRWATPEDEARRWVSRYTAALRQ